MSDYIFLFDMDSTITRKEVLPEVSKRIGKLDEMRRLTEATMRGEIPFRTSFLNRVKILSDISVSEVNQVVSEIPLNPYIADFIENNRDRCYVVTGNLDVWISGLMKKLKMENHCYCSKADVKNDRISKVVSVVGFGGVSPIAQSLLRNSDFAFYDDKRCADFLWQLL